MSMLQRYRKTGGFEQLVQLIESCAPTKREHLLGLITNEDPKWAELVHQKMLTRDKIFSWDQEVLMEFCPQVPNRTMATFLYEQAQDHIGKVLETLSKFNREEVLSIMDDITPTTAEVQAAIVQVIGAVREQCKAGRINLTRIDPNLDLSDVA